MSIEVFLLDDHEQVRTGLRRLIEMADDLVVVGESSRAAEALPQILAAQPDVAMLDVHLPDGTGIEVCRAIRSQQPQVRCILLTGYAADEALVAAAVAGAAGYLSKPINANELRDAIRLVAGGQALGDTALTERALARLRPGSTDPRLGDLTAQERQILNLVADGRTNPEIADDLRLSELYVQIQIAKILATLGIN